MFLWLWLAMVPVDDPVDFVHEVAPILREHCIQCHANGTYKGALSLETRESILDALAVEPGLPDKSELWLRISSDDPDERMPEDAPALSAEELAVIRRWITEGAAWEPGFTFKQNTYRAPVALQPVELPPVQEGREHPVDRIVDAYLAEHGIPRSETIDDEQFLRRASLDLLGLLPTPEERLAFLADERPDRRAQLVHSLLARDVDYADHWLTFWNDRLRNDYSGTGYIDGGRQQITKWLYTALRENRPYDRFVRELIAPTPESAGFGRGIRWRGEVNASQTVELQFAQNVGQVFLGVNLKCASCHDSFVDDWKLADAYGMAAIVSEKPLELHRCDVPQGTFAEPRFLFPQLGTIPSEAPVPERLEALAGIITSADNGLFARTIVHRLWHQLFGVGLVTPIDGLDRRPWSEDLMEHLAGHLVKQGYDLKQVLAHIATSDVYRWKCAAAPTEEFRGPVPRSLTAEELVDAVWRVTDTAPDELEAPVDATLRGDRPVRAALRRASLFQRALGRPNREQVVTERRSDLTRLQALELFNGAEFAQMIAHGAEALKARQLPVDDEIRYLWWSLLGRDPRPEEFRLAREWVDTQPMGREDLLWLVLMLPEFQTHH